MLEAVRGAGAGALIATHNPELAGRMDRTVRLRDGLVDGSGGGAASLG
jgi:lipoprotein-releasing system ATP-binding protein